MPQFLEICITAYGDFKAVYLSPRKNTCTLFSLNSLCSGSGNLMMSFKFTPTALVAIATKCPKVENFALQSPYKILACCFHLFTVTRNKIMLLLKIS